MHVIHRLAALVGNIFRRQEKDRELSREMALLLEMMVDEKRRRGLSETEARRQALIEMGGREQLAERLREVRSGAFLDVLLQDVKYAFRALRRNPGFSVVAVVTLALGIGANTAIFSVVNGVLLQPLPFADPDRLVTIWSGWGDNGGPFAMSLPECFEIQERQRSFGVLGTYHDARASANLTAAGVEPVHVSVHQTEGAVITALGVPPLVGRNFTPNEEQPGQNRAVLLEHGFWLRRFGGDRSVVGSNIALDGTDFLVVGVMPAGFKLPFHDFPTDLWVPLALNRAQAGRRDSYKKFFAVARLQEGVTWQQADDDMLRIQREWKEEYPDSYIEEYADFEIKGIASLLKNTTREVETTLLILLSAVGLVLLISCANVASLLLSKATARRQEIGVRLALGAGRGRLIRQLLTESTLLALLGGLAGLSIAGLGVRLLTTFGPREFPRLESIGIDATVLGFTLAVSIVAAVGFGLLPAVRSTRADVHESLKEGGRETGASRRGPLQNLVVVGEVALSLVLLVGAGLLASSFYNLMEVDRGFETEGVLSFRLRPASGQYSSEQVVELYNALLRRARAIPGVEAAGAIAYGPLSGWGRASATYLAEGRPDDAPRLRAYFRVATPGYFRATGTTLLAGRLLEESDSRSSPKVVIVDENFVRMAWPDDPSGIGKRVAFISPFYEDEVTWRTVVGVVANAQNLRLPGDEVAQIYFPLAQTSGRDLQVLVRTSGNPADFVPQLRQHVAALDSQLPIYEVTTLEERLSETVAGPRFNAALMGFFALLALTLGVIGLYGVIAHAVGCRKHEIGVRLAMGARPVQIVAMVLRQGLLLTAAGLAGGLVASLVLTRFLESLLFGVAAVDWATYGAVSLLLLAATAAASMIPARRATRVDPVSALRSE